MSCKNEAFKVNDMTRKEKKGENGGHSPEQEFECRSNLK